MKAYKIWHDTPYSNVTGKYKSYEKPKRNI